MGNYNGWNDHCAYSPSTDPAPPKSGLQGDAGTPHRGYLKVDGVRSTSRGGNTKAPGGKVMAPRPKPNGTPGGAVHRRVS